MKTLHYNILIHSTDIELHKKYLKTVLEILKDYTVQINFDTSFFMKHEVIYLCHITRINGIIPDLNRIKSFQIPDITKNSKFQQILGLLDWFRPYVRNFAEKMKGNYNKLNSESKNSWNESDTERVREVSNDIKKTLLSYPDISKPFDIYTDASYLRI